MSHLRNVFLLARQPFDLNGELEGCIGLALAEQVATGDGALSHIFGEVDADDTEGGFWFCRFLG